MSLAEEAAGPGLCGKLSGEQKDQSAIVIIVSEVPPPGRILAYSDQ